MSLNQLTQSKSTPSERPKRSLAWLLPAGLLVGFLIIMALLFGERLIPATQVNTAPVITLRQETGASTDTTNGEEQTKGKMLFQASGWVEPDPYTTFVSTLVDGVIDEVHVLEGHAVKKGDLLATLVDDDAKLNLRQAELQIDAQKKRIDAHCKGIHIIEAQKIAATKQVAAIQAQLAEADDNYRRLKNIPAGAVSEQQVMAAKLDHQRQAALAEEAQAEIPRLTARNEQIDLERITMTARLEELETMRDMAKLAFDRTRILAPSDGIVLHLHVAPGTKRIFAMDDPKSAIVVELYDPNQLQARIDVALSEAASMQIGQIVELNSDLLPNTTFEGVVTRIVGEADIQRNTLQAKVSIKNPDLRLRPGMLVRSKFFNATPSNKSNSEAANSGRLALYVPEAALVDEQTVWVVSSQQKADLRKIKLSAESKDNHRQVLEGLRSGEQVILPPHQDLQPGARLQTTH